MSMNEYEEHEDWVIEGNDDYVFFEADKLNFTPSDRHNLLGHVAEWTAKLDDWQVEALASIADEDGGSMRIDWGVFMCPAYLLVKEKLLVVNTEGTW